MRTVAILSAAPRVLVGLSDYGQDAPHDEAGVEQSVKKLLELMG